MKLWRSFLVFAEMSLFGVGALVIGLVVFPLLGFFTAKEKRRERYAQIIRHSWKFFIWIIESTGVIKVNVNGDLSKIKGKIIAASHPSFIDIILLIGQMPKSLCLVKKEILKNPIMSNIVKSLYIINDIDTNEFTNSALEALKEGYNIVIFPTGTRTIPEENIKIHKGAAQIAITSGVNIVPIKIETDYPFLQKHKSPFDAGTKPVNYNITVLPEINTADYNIDELGEIKVRSQISEKIKKCIS